VLRYLRLVFRLIKSDHRYYVHGTRRIAIVDQQGLKTRIGIQREADVALRGTLPEPQVECVAIRALAYHVVSHTFVK
jgi:hypothetical protein